MKPHGTYKLTHTRSRLVAREAASGLEYPGEAFELHTHQHALGRCRRIVDSLVAQILAGGPDQSLRIRQIFSRPREIYRLEIREPAFHYHRMTLLDRDTLEELLEIDEIRERVLAHYGC